MATQHLTAELRNPSAATESPACSIVSIPDSILLDIFHRVEDAQSLVYCSCVCKSWFQKVKEVQDVTLIAPRHFKSYWDKVMDVVDKASAFPSLEKLKVRFGTPCEGLEQPQDMDSGASDSSAASWHQRAQRESEEQWRRCLRYAELGTSVDKFLFLAARTAHPSIFRCGLTSPPPASETPHSAAFASEPAGGVPALPAESPPGTSFAFQRPVSLEVSQRLTTSRSDSSLDTLASRVRTGVALADDSGEETLPPAIQPVPVVGTATEHTDTLTFGLHEPVTTEQTGGGAAAAAAPAGVSLDLRQVMGPRDDSLRRMMPVIVFAIVRCFDELRDVLPCLLLKLPRLSHLLLVDPSDNVTINIRPHHVAQLRAAKGASMGLEGGDDATLAAMSASSFAESVMESANDDGQQEREGNEEGLRGHEALGMRDRGGEEGGGVGSSIPSSRPHGAAGGAFLAGPSTAGAAPSAIGAGAATEPLSQASGPSRSPLAPASGGFPAVRPSAAPSPPPSVPQAPPNEPPEGGRSSREAPLPPMDPGSPAPAPVSGPQSAGGEGQQAEAAALPPAAAGGMPAEVDAADAAAQEPPELIHGAAAAGAAGTGAGAAGAAAAGADAATTSASAGAAAAAADFAGAVATGAAADAADADAVAGVPGLPPASSSLLEHPDFSVSIWRCEQLALGGPLRASNVSVCVATTAAVALSSDEVAEVGRAAVGGHLLAAVLRHLAERAAPQCV